MSSHSTAARRSTLLLDQIGEPVEVGAAPLGPEPGPVRKSLGGGAQCRLGLLGAAGGDPREHLAVDRAEVVEALRRGDALAADEVVGGDLDPGDLGDVGVSRGPVRAEESLLISPRSQLGQGLEVVDGVAEGEAKALADPRRGECGELLARGVE